MQSLKRASMKIWQGTHIKFHAYLPSIGLRTARLCALSLLKRSPAAGLGRTACLPAPGPPARRRWLNPFESAKVLLPCPPCSRPLCARAATCLTAPSRLPGNECEGVNQGGEHHGPIAKTRTSCREHRNQTSYLLGMPSGL